MIREASVYTLKKIPPAELVAYGMRVLTMRRWPRGVARRDIDIWVPDAGPSVSLLAALRTGAVDWDQFLARYWEEQEQQETCRVVSYEQGEIYNRSYSCCSLMYLAHLARARGTITIVCWEQNECCHRFTLAQRLNQLMGKETTMAGNGQLPVSTNKTPESLKGGRKERFRAIVWAPADNKKGTPRTRQETLYDGPDVAELRRICSNYHRLEVPERRGFYDIRYYRGRERLYAYNLPKA